jgi:beta-galactosidase
MKKKNVVLLGIALVMSGAVALAAERPLAFAYRSFWPEFGAMGQFKEAGVDTVCIFAANTDNSLGLPYSKYPLIWRWFGKYDFESLDKQYDDVLKVNPDANFICMIDLNTPVWLHHQLALKGQSAECESFTMLSCACANPVWRKETTSYLEAVVKHMEERYGDRIKAYLLACGQTDEWMDYSRGNAGRFKTQAWKNWLKDHGKKEMPVPSFERLDKASFNNLIRDPATEGDVTDYAHFTGDLIADTVLGFTTKTRSLIPAQRKIGMFFGYIMELTYSRMVWAGHLEYERLYSAPSIDFFISPGTYADRPIGGGSGFMVPNGTRVLNGKGFLHEIDHRTPTYNVNLDEFVSIGWMVPWKDQAQVDAGFKREFSLAIINQTSLWCFDMWGGVFKTEPTMKIVQQSKKIWDRCTAVPLKSRAEVALVVDPQSARMLNDKHGYISHINQATRNKLNRLGAPFEVFSFNDLARADLSAYKLFVFPGLFELTQKKAAVLRKYVFNKDRTSLFVYAPGISDGKNLDTARVKTLTGSAFKAPGVSTVQQEGWTSVYLPDYNTLTPTVLRKAAVDAGVTIYCEDPVPVYANERFFAVHMAEGGMKRITLPLKCSKVKELYTGRVIPVKDRHFSYAFASPDTALFEIVK